MRVFVPRRAHSFPIGCPSISTIPTGSGPNAVGYDNDGRLNSLISFDIHDEIFGVNPGAYIRVPFEVEDPSLLETLEFSLRYDDGFVAYLNGVEVARRNAPATPVWNSGTSTPRPIEEDKELEGFNLTRDMHLLRPGTNVLAIHALNLTIQNPDMLISPVLKAGRVLDAGISPSAMAYSGPITVPAGAMVKARACSGPTSGARCGRPRATRRSFHCGSRK